MVRGVSLPSTDKYPMYGRAHRPSPRRSYSIASTSSSGTLRRTPSHRTMRPGMRRRTSSIASHIPESLDSDDDDDRGSLWNHTGSLPHLSAWSTQDLSNAVHAHLVCCFVTFSGCHGEEFYRTPISSSVGLHHQWGKTLDSSGSPDGINLSTVETELKHAEIFHICVWTKLEPGPSVRKGKTRTHQTIDNEMVEVGKERDLGWSVALEYDVNLGELKRLRGNVRIASSTQSN